MWTIIGKIRCPDHFARLIRSFHDGMEARVNVGGILVSLSTNVVTLEKHPSTVNYVGNHSLRILILLSTNVYTLEKTPSTVKYVENLLSLTVI